MPAVAQRRLADSSQPATTHQTRKTRRAQPRRKFRAWRKPSSVLTMLVVGPMLIMALLLGWMSIYARLTVTGYSRSELASLCRQEQLRNQRLKLRVDAMCMPNNVVAAAQKSGMVYATRYDYVNKTTTVASANKGIGD